MKFTPADSKGNPGVLYETTPTPTSPVRLPLPLGKRVVSQVQITASLILTDQQELKQSLWCQWSQVTKTKISLCHFTLTDSASPYFLFLYVKLIPETPAKAAFLKSESCKAALIESKFLCSSKYFPPQL